MKVEYNKAPFSKRIFAFLFDLACYFILGSLIAFGLYSALPEMPFYKNANETHDSIRLESHLYIESEGNIIRIDDANKTKEVAIANESYEEALSYFYTLDTFFKDGEGTKIYEDQKIGDNAIVDALGEIYWQKEGDVISPRSDYSEEKMNEFYVKALGEYAFNYLSNSKEYVEASRIVTFAGLIFIPIIINICALVFSLAIPLFLRRGRKTLGKLVFGLSVLNVHALPPKWWHYLLRFAFFLIIEVNLSLVAFAIPLIVSFSMVVFSKTGQSLHDYVCNTYVLDTKGKTVYLTQEEYMIAQDKLNSIDVRKPGSLLGTIDGNK